MVGKRNKATNRPSAFTLVELLVVMAIIALLAALVIAFFPSISSQTSEAQGAMNLQGWANIARQKAIRNQQPFGLRLWVKDPTLFGGPTTYYVSECQYIEQPDDYAGGPAGGGSITIGPDALGSNTIVSISVDPTGQVLPGDYLEVLGSGLMHQITAVSSTQLNLATQTPFPINSATSSFRILRQPRVVGEEVLALPSGVFVDLGTNGAFGNNVPIQRDFAVPPGPQPVGYHLDVLFSPSGAVITPGQSGNYMALWVRQPDPNNVGNVFAGTPSLIVVWGQTGLVAAYTPVPGNPYVDVK